MIPGATFILNDLVIIFSTSTTGGRSISFVPSEPQRCGPLDDALQKGQTRLFRCLQSGDFDTYDDDMKFAKSSVMI